MKPIKLIFTLLLFSIYGCSQHNHNVTFFKDTEAYELAKAIEKNDIKKIEKIVKRNPKLLEISNEISGSNALALSLRLENYESFKKLLELGANPNFINPFSKYSILIEAIKFYTKPEDYSINLNYVQLLLDKGADPNYEVEKEFVDKKGNHHFPKSPMTEAAQLNINLVKLLIKYGGNPYKINPNTKETPFGHALKGFKGSLLTSNYFIDSLKVNIFAPLYINEEYKDTLFIQDYIINKYSLATIKGDKETIKKLEMENDGIGEANKELLAFIAKLEKLGVDFKNYKYKRQK